MKEYRYTKTLGTIVGTLTIVAAVGLGILFVIGMGLSKAFHTGSDLSSAENLVLIIILPLVGLIPVIGTLWLKGRTWRIFYVGFCFMLGIGFIAAFLVSYGSIGFKSERFILFIGITYFLLGYLAKLKK